MTCIVFVGPSLPEALGRELLPGAVFENPARCGDVYRAERRGARWIGLIDGYFEHSLSVWHKEILWALSRGVRVYGAGSMGALRAAELASFGMVGVGRTFEQFRAGELEDDDEVAVVHEPSEQHYRVRSEAMVNIRATLERAVAHGSLDVTSAARLLAETKALFYPERTAGALMRIATQQLDPTKSRSFRRWLDEHGVVNQKRTDAEELLRRMAADRRSTQGEDFRPRFCLANTDAWHTLRTTIDEEHGREEPTPEATRLPRTVDVASALEKLQRIDPLRHGRLVRSALERALALVLAEGMRTSPDPSEVQSESESFRQKRGLLTCDQTERWLELNGLDVAAFSRLIYGNVLCKSLGPVISGLVLDQMRDVLAILDDGIVSDEE